MSDELQIDRERRRRVWGALVGVLVFALLGVLLAPGLVTRRAPPQPTGTGVALFPPERAARPELPRSETGWLDDFAAAPPPADANAGPHAFDCMIGPAEVIEIGSAMTGLIDEVLVERGERVEAGQVVAKLEATVELAAVGVARARAQRLVDIEAGRASLDLSEKRRARALQLFESGALSLDVREEIEAETKLASLELERAREDHRLAELQLEQAVAALARRTIRSPVSGVVVERLLAPGEVVDEETLMRIAQIDPLRVEAILPSDWFGRMRQIERAEVIPEPPLDALRSAEVEIVDPVIDAASGTFGVRLTLPNPDHDLPAGLRCQVRFLEGAPAEVSAQ